MGVGTHAVPIMRRKVQEALVPGGKRYDGSARRPNAELGEFEDALGDRRLVQALENQPRKIVVFFDFRQVTGGLRPETCLGRSLEKF